MSFATPLLKAVRKTCTATIPGALEAAKSEVQTAVNTLVEQRAPGLQPPLIACGAGKHANRMMIEMEHKGQVMKASALFNPLPGELSLRPPTPALSSETSPTPRPSPLRSCTISSSPPALLSGGVHTQVAFQRRAGCQVWYLTTMRELKKNWPDPGEEMAQARVASPP
jgi:hypothetical protein